MLKYIRLILAALLTFLCGVTVLVMFQKVHTNDVYLFLVCTFCMAAGLVLLLLKAHDKQAAKA